MDTQQFVTETRVHPFGGEQVIYMFPNGYGASVIPVRDYETGGTVPNVLELAVLDSAGELTYSTPVTDDVERVSVEDLPALLERIAGI
jgi:hypothetical protein